MADDPPIPRKKTLGELKSAAIAQLERRGYDIRGKTPAQIRQLLKRRPTKPTPPFDSSRQFTGSAVDLTRGHGLTGGKRE
jgi:hypothetical protein